MTEWHVPGSTLLDWVVGRTSLATSASVEQHLIACSRCRDDVATLDDEALGTDLEMVWRAVREEVEPPPRSALARLLVRIGLPEHDAVLIAATPSLSMPWLIAVVIVLTFAAAAGSWVTPGGAGAFLLLAPLVPLAGVAVAYGAEVDPLHEVVIAAPTSQVRLLLLRTVAVLAVCTPVTLLASLTLPGPWWLGFVWLAPASAFVSLTLAAATFVEPLYAATAIAITWTAVMLPSIVAREPLAPFSPTVLTLDLLVAVAALAVLGVRSSRLSLDRRSR